MTRKTFAIAVSMALSACAAPATSESSNLGSIRASVTLTMQSGGPPVDRVHLELTPDGGNTDLSQDAVSGQWFGTLPSVKVGVQTITITAYSGSTVVGHGSGAVTVTKRNTASVFIKVYDNSTLPAGWDHGPIITSITTSAGSPMQTDTVDLTVTAVDPDGNPLSYAWSKNCGGTFTTATTVANPSFTDDAIEACTLTATVTSNGLTDTAIVPVNFQQAYGSVYASAAFIPVPWIRSMAALGGGMNCSLVRGGNDGSCRPSPPGGSDIAITVTFDPVPVDSGATIVLTDNCSGSSTTGAVDLAGAGTAAFTWHAPAGANSCIVTATITRDGLFDTAGIGIATH